MERERKQQSAETRARIEAHRAHYEANDSRLGVGVGATRQRARLKAAIGGGRG